ncbi:MAG: HEAT repeat domain-containing protein [Vicinamibacterales bacterium]
MTRVGATIVIGIVVGLGVWFYARSDNPPPEETSSALAAEWLDHLYSHNPREVEAASEEVAALGARALPAVQAALRDPNSEAERIKGALKACGIIGHAAAPAIPEVTALLTEPGVTSEAAIALSFMGKDALPPLSDALKNSDPVVRREALRSIGKLKDRAPLDVSVVMPLLAGGLGDPDAGVRAVAATYLGIIHEAPEEAVPALAQALTDPDAEVRRSAAAALASFDAYALPALSALQKASTDRNEDVAREATRTIVKLQGTKERQR